MRIRQGKDILLRWKVLTNVQELSLEGRNITLVMTTPVGREKALEHGVEGSVVVARLLGTTLTHLGDYTLTLWENRGKEGQTAVDAVNAFELVKYSTMEDGNPSCGNLEYEVAELSTASMDVLTGGGAGGGIVSLEIVDSLDSDASDKALSARQGKVLGMSLESLEGEIEAVANETETKVSSEPTEQEIEAIEPSLVSTALRKTAQVLTEDEKEQARQNIGAQKQLQLTVKDNGNIVLSNLEGETMEFMPATPSGDPMHYAYVSAGAEYNATTDYILKDAPWKDMVDAVEDKAAWGLDVVDASNVKKMTIKGVEYNYATENRTSPEGGTYLRYFLVGQGSNGVWVEDETKVLHLPKCWYLNGLGDITNAEILRCYEESPKNVGNYVNQQFGKWSKARTLNANASAYSYMGISYLFVNNVNIEVPNINWAAYDISNMLYKATRIRYMLNIRTPNNPTIDGSYCNTVARINGAFSSATSLRGCFLSGLIQSVSFSSCGNISKPSILRVITKATPSSAITITLHADAYARLAEDADIVAALEAKPLVTLVSA